MEMSNHVVWVWAEPLFYAFFIFLFPFYHHKQLHFLQLFACFYFYIDGISWYCLLFDDLSCIYLFPLEDLYHIHTFKVFPLYFHFCWDIQDYQWEDSFAPLSDIFSWLSLVMFLSCYVGIQVWFHYRSRFWFLGCLLLVGFSILGFCWLSGF